MAGRVCAHAAATVQRLLELLQQFPVQHGRSAGGVVGMSALMQHPVVVHPRRHVQVVRAQDPVPVRRHEEMRVQRSDTVEGGTVHHDTAQVEEGEGDGYGFRHGIHGIVAGTAHRQHRVHCDVHVREGIQQADLFRQLCPPTTSRPRPGR